MLDERNESEFGGKKQFLIIRKHADKETNVRF